MTPRKAAEFILDNMAKPNPEYTPEDLRDLQVACIARALEVVYKAGHGAALNVERGGTDRFNVAIKDLQRVV